MRILRPLVAALALAAGAAPLAAQSAPAPAAPAQPSRAEQEREVRAVIDRLFDGMRAADSAAVRAVFHPEARLQTTAVRDGRPVLRTDSLAVFLRAVGTPRTEVWDERISNVEIRADGELASAWMDYAFYVSDRYSHCGVNAVQFARTPGGWQIIQLADTRRRQCANSPAAPAAN